jgi:hypothetical protein
MTAAPTRTGPNVEGAGRPRELAATAARVR